MLCTEEQIALIKEGKCPICKSDNTDFISVGFSGGTDECCDCGAYWNVITTTLDNVDINHSEYEKEYFAFLKYARTDEELFEADNTYNEFWKKKYKLRYEVFINGSSLIEGLKTAFPEFKDKE
jgi:hypothetical protein